MRIAVFCGSATGRGQEYALAAASVGRLLAERGIEPLPNPPVPWPDWLAARTDGDPGTA